MSQATAVMPKKLDKPAEYSVYRPIKVDEEVLTLLKFAVAKLARGGRTTTMQELASDLINEGAAKLAGEHPVKRKPPPPKPRP